MTEKTLIDSERLFGLAYWPALPAFLLSTASTEGVPHVSPFSLVTFSSYTGVAENPGTPRIVSVVIGDYDRYEEVQEHITYRNIRETGEFVLNVPTTRIVEQVNRTAVPNEDKFGVAGLTPAASTVVSAPSVAECPVNLECKLEAIDNRRWLGEIVYGRVVATLVDPALESVEPAERQAALSPLYHHAYAHEGGRFYGPGEALLEEGDQ